eukprot:6200015-Pleurochrysis_carterae.AAC.2
MAVRCSRASNQPSPRAWHSRPMVQVQRAAAAMALLPEAETDPALPCGLVREGACAISGTTSVMAWSKMRVDKGVESGTIACLPTSKLVALRD